MFFWEYILGDFVSLAVISFTFLILYYKWTYQYWRRRNLPFLEPKIPFGTSANPFTRKEHTGIRVKRHYDMMKARGWKHGGLFGTVSPTYMVVDLDYVRNVLTKDFHHFTDRFMYYNEKDDPLSAHIFSLGGTKWRNLRTKLTPTFTSGRMKMMFQILVECTDTLLEKIAAKDTAIDIKEQLGCFTTDIIGSCAFGLECQSFKDEDSPFRTYGRKFFSVDKRRLASLVFATSFPNLARLLGICFTPRDVSDFFVKVVKDTVSYREENNLTRKDFMQLLIDLKNNKLEVEEKVKGEVGSLTMDELAAQSFLFFIAGFETSSTTMTFTLYELARHQDIQQRMRDEIEKVLGKHDGKITYEAIQDMKYMDQVINESLRMHPPVPFLMRKCVKDYKVPDEDVVIEKGTSVVISVQGIHYDEDYYPDPEKFDPERFSEANKNNRHGYAHLPFGEGPRNCLGTRFGLMQTKVGLTTLLKNYKFTVNRRTREPIKIKVTSFVPTADGDIWLDAKKL